jgi:2-polyprenyl-3-methyl-5-hydroxy-6-metoxy-1,4-benzoquinol methylase
MQIEQKAKFADRSNCITCGSSNLIQVSSGLFREDPLRSLIENDPWGESPLPYVNDEQWSFVRCGDCSTRFHKRILDSEWIVKCYSDWVTQDAMERFVALQNTPNKRFDTARRNVSHILRLEKLTQDIRGSDSLRVLDFGCGWGEFLAMCTRFGFDGYGIDFSPDRRKQGQVSIFPSIEDLKSEIPKGRNEYFHVVTMFEVLEHLADPLKILKSLNNLILPDGILILETPDCTGVDGIRNERDYRAIHPLSHINAFTPQSLREIAKSAGFVPINSGVAQVTCDLRRVIKTEVKRLIGNFLKPTTQQYFRKA